VSKLEDPNGRQTFRLGSLMVAMGCKSAKVARRAHDQLRAVGNWKQEGQRLLTAREQQTETEMDKNWSHFFSSILSASLGQSNECLALLLQHHMIEDSRQTAVGRRLSAR